MIAFLHVLGFLCVLRRQGIHAAPAPAPHPTDHAHATKSPVEMFHEHVKHEVHHLYQAMDYNHDGLFDKQDLPLFIQESDLDKNGTIERAEYETNFDMLEPTLAIVANGLFLEFDADQSGHIDMSDMNALYSRMDLNSDDCLGYSAPSSSGL
ncbi:hypothetical protein V1264_006740 [Littorina saxatilis]|uniref:EF-hand domain-containing protein n=1 Tax=Littorina saxatilis TaxID=31220 RepID=A0AAN9G662_9CAEN